jgi:hypothetical protein
VTQPGRRPIDAALVYAGRGWPVFPTHNPVAAREGSGCSCAYADCSSVGKHPRIKEGLKAASTDEAQIREWWNRWPKAGVAIRTGAESGLVVVDIDPDHGGERSLADLVDRHGDLPAGRTIRTGGGGTHLYFQHPGHTIPNSAGKLGSGIDIRGDGGYVIAPPSRHRSQRSYAVIAHGGIIPELPTWVVRALAPEPERQRTIAARPPRDANAWARAAVNGELGRLRQAGEGSRNDTLNRVAYRLGQIIGAGALAEHDVEPLLIEQGIAVGLREREVVKTVHSGLKAGEGSPRSPAIALPGPSIVDT